jgi:hypothetical protein
MKWNRQIYLAILAVFSIATAYAVNYNSKMDEQAYTNQTDDGTYTKVTDFNPLNCLNNSSHPCYYKCPVDLGPTATEAQLKAAGCLGSVVQGVYVP